MARRRKNRTHVKAAKAPTDAPRSFIVKHGQVGHALSQLVRDMRKVMEPNTASRLKERTRNKLKDYLVLAPALQVSHLLAFTVTPVAPSMRIVRLPGGPSLTFRVERYSLMKDVLGARKRSRSIGLEYLTPPLVVLASFPPASPNTNHLSLAMKTFQSLFPPLAPQNLTLSSARRVVLVSYNEDRDTMDFRHYLITVKAYGVSRRVRQIVEGKKTGSKSSHGFLDLGNEKDVADFLLRRKGEPGPDDDGYETATSSASSAAGDDGDAVSLVDDYVGRNNKKGQRRAVRLDEVGPRMELRLIKITEGMPGKEGDILYHALVKKSKKETATQKAAHAEKEKLRKQRREEQERNVQRKKDQLTAKGKSKQEDPDEEASEGDEGESEGEEVLDDDDHGWDENEEISEDELSEVDADSESESEEEDVRPPKKSRLKAKR